MYKLKNDIVLHKISKEIEHIDFKCERKILIENDLNK
jgi:hypothetical protein